MPRRKPLIAVPACRKAMAEHWFHAVGEKYIEAVHDGAGAIPLLLPALGSRVEIRELLRQVDGLMLTGSLSNVEPHHYGGEPSEPGTLHDAHRDATTLPLIPAAVEAGLPLLAVCRGCQEMNVAFGGSLFQKIQDQPGYLDHREDPAQPAEVQYGPAHEIRLEQGGLLRSLVNEERVMVNSLHSQGVARLAPGMRVEATAPDGLVEAFRVEAAPAFALAVQWHPEWKFRENALSSALFEAFGEACRRYTAGR